MSFEPEVEARKWLDVHRYTKETLADENASLTDLLRKAMAAGARSGAADVCGVVEAALGEFRREIEQGNADALVSLQADLAAAEKLCEAVDKWRDIAPRDARVALAEWAEGSEMSEHHRDLSEVEHLGYDSGPSYEDLQAEVERLRQEWENMRGTAMTAEYERSQLAEEVERLKQERDTAVAAEYATVGEFAQAKIDAERARAEKLEAQVAALREELDHLLQEWMAWNPGITGLARTRAERVLADTESAAAALKNLSARLAAAEKVCKAARAGIECVCSDTPGHEESCPVMLIGVALAEWERGRKA